MKYTCAVEAEVLVGDKIVKSKNWPVCDIMKTSVTRAWATRQFNKFLKEVGKDIVVRVEWTAKHTEAQGHGTLRGTMGGVNGKCLAKRGIFECY